MPEAVDVIILVLLIVAALVFLVAVIGMFIARSALDRMHFLSAITSGATPLVAIAAAINEGFSLSAGALLLTGAIVGVTGPALAMALGRLIEQERAGSAGESPE